MTINIANNLQMTFMSTFSDSFAIGCLFFLVITLFLTLLLSNKRLGFCRRFTLTTLFNVLSFLAVIALVSDIKLKSNDDLSAVLLTYGTNQQQIDTLSVESNIPVYILPANNNWQHSVELSHLANQVEIIDNASEIYLFQTQIGNIDVYGDGLTQQQWHMFNAMAKLKSSVEKQQNNVNIRFHPSAIKTGPVSLYWAKQLVQGQPFNISGIFKAESTGENRIYKVVLSDIHGEAMSEMLVKHNESFSLTTTVKNEGLFSYQLQIFDDNVELIVSEPVAFSVSSSEKVKIAIKQSSASFESKYLKNWLTDQGEEVLVLTKISKDKSIQQRINSSVEQSAINSTQNGQNVVKGVLSTTWLNSFDLLYIDGRALLSLSNEENNQLNKAVTNGLGVIVMVDDELIMATELIENSSSLAKRFINNMVKNSVVDADSLTTIPSWLHREKELPITYKSIQLAEKDEQTVLINGSEGQPLWVKYSYGLGSIAFSLIDTSYKWRTSGETVHYSRYWQSIISKVARQKQTSGWQPLSDNEIYFQGQGQQVCAQLNIGDVKVLKSEDINLLNSAVSQSSHCGKYWADTAGWHTLHLTNNKSDSKQAINSLQHSPIQPLNIYFYKENNWKSWQQQIKHKASLFASKVKVTNNVEPSYQTINKLYIWWLFFISLFILWYERKTF